MSTVSDIDHYFGEDVGVTPSGDIALSANHDRTVQRAIRRLLTAPASSSGSGYAWEPIYGAGLPLKVGQENIDPDALRATVLSQLLVEPTVARIPIPGVKVTQAAGGGTITLDVTYTDISGTPQSFGFDLA